MKLQFGLKTVTAVFKFLAGLLIFSWLFAVALIAFAPAEWLLSQARQQGLVHQVSWQGLQGTLASGTAESLSVGQVNLANLSWQLSWPRLLVANLNLHLQLGASSQATENWQANISFMPWGKLNASLQGGELSQVTGTTGMLVGQGMLAGTVTMQGHLKNFKHLSCTNLNGRLQGKLDFVRPLALQLGEVTLEPSCPKADLFAVNLQAHNAGQHLLDLESKANQQSWSFSGTAKVEPDAQLHAILQMLGWRQVSTGNYQGRSSGKF